MISAFLIFWNATPWYSAGIFVVLVCMMVPAILNFLTRLAHLIYKYSRGDEIVIYSYKAVFGELDTAENEPSDRIMFINQCWSDYNVPRSMLETFLRLIAACIIGLTWPASVPALLTFWIARAIRERNLKKINVIRTLKGEEELT